MYTPVCAQRSGEFYLRLGVVANLNRKRQVFVASLYDPGDRVYVGLTTWFDIDAIFLIVYIERGVKR